MLAEASLVDLAHQVGQVLAHNIPGNFLKCGVGRGAIIFTWPAFWCFDYLPQL
jgi:hypothetical protein